ncbi:unnamed protein product [Brachionus calyciflorus]|uniref:Uncharacterized protein n=1 Tax=Brachionus calyciflorus TaxID=104777 RepID=A0A814AT36_9BILA|nr:unnamed protein product [Brachionus calyciflorus]
MIRVLDILEDYLIQMRSTYERLDGRIRGEARQEAIDQSDSDSSSTSDENKDQNKKDKSKKKKCGRPTGEDAAYNNGDDDNDSKVLSREECYKVEKLLLIYGWPRWAKILSNLSFKFKQNKMFKDAQVQIYLVQS